MNCFIRCYIHDESDDGDAIYCDYDNRFDLLEEVLGIDADVVTVTMELIVTDKSLDEVIAEYEACD